MIQRPIRTVMQSGVADRTIVSTDDDEIARLAEDAGADVPFVRPVDLADDHTATVPVIAHAIGEIARGGEAYDHVLVVYPTAVLLDPEDLRVARDAVVEGGHRLAFSVCRFPAPIERAWRRDRDGTGRMDRADHAGTRTQDLEPSFFDAGQFYFGTTEFWSSDGDIPAASPFLVELPRSRAVDIDTEDDFAEAERLISGEL